MLIYAVAVFVCLSFALAFPFIFHLNVLRCQTNKGTVFCSGLFFVDAFFSSNK